MNSVQHRFGLLVIGVSIALNSSAALAQQIEKLPSTVEKSETTSDKRGTSTDKKSSDKKPSDKKPASKAKNPKTSAEKPKPDKATPDTGGTHRGPDTGEGQPPTTPGGTTDPSTQKK